MKTHEAASHAAGSTAEAAPDRPPTPGTGKENIEENGDLLTRNRVINFYENETFHKALFKFPCQPRTSRSAENCRMEITDEQSP